MRTSSTQHAVGCGQWAVGQVDRCTGGPVGGGMTKFSGVLADEKRLRNLAPCLVEQAGAVSMK